MDEGEAVVETLPIRHSDLWFSDGSVSVVKLYMTRHDFRLILLEIVLRAENTLFRVHKSLLARHSGFFHDLFTLPKLVAKDSSPPHGKKTPNVDLSGDVEGCQVLILYDSAEDVANLLTALVDGPYVTVSSSLTSLIKMFHKGFWQERPH